MCGFTGFYEVSTVRPESQSIEILSKMCDQIAHRGPDAFGLWYDRHSNVWFGHRRLAILDISPAGAQPMRSISNRYTIIFNGEIYNHQHLRLLIESENGSRIWKGQSDTETLLVGFEIWGIVKTINAAVGMFSLAVWDKCDKNIFLIRDRFGEKPMYYGWQRSGNVKAFLFGSDLDAFKKHPAFEGKVSRKSVIDLLQFGCIGGSKSIYCGINKLLPGRCLILNTVSNEISETAFWSSKLVAKSAVNSCFKGEGGDAVDQVEQLLIQSVKGQMLSDAPIGAFLSGGIDSSLIVALMQEASNQPVKTFTIGNSDGKYNESEHARRISNEIGTDHTELIISQNDAVEIIPRLPYIYSEPFADSSQIPTAIVSRLAGLSVKVAVTGDGADELFGGYDRYLWAVGMWNILSKIPISMRRGVGLVLDSVLMRYGENLNDYNFLPMSYDRIHKGVKLLDSENLSELYRRLIASRFNVLDIVIGLDDKEEIGCENELDLFQFGDVEGMMLKDHTSYLPNDILVKVDRASMAFGLETRAPFLDHRLVELVWSIPTEFKIRNRETKWLLKQILYKRVAPAFFDRPKMGFAVPLNDWLRGPLLNWTEDLLSEDKIRRDGVFNADIIRNKWAEHLSGRRNWGVDLWKIIMFQAWMNSK